MKYLLAVAALALAGRCSHSDPEQADARTPAASAPRAAQARTAQRELDWISDLSSCDIEHQGLFLDLGTPAVDRLRDHSVGPFNDVTVSERAGASFARIHTRRIAYDFTLTAPQPKVTVSLRGLGVISRQVSVYLDDHRIGIAVFSRDEPTTVSIPSAEDLTAGPHTVTLRFSGSAQGADDPYVEIDWLRIGPALPPGAGGTQKTESYAPPTLHDVVTDVVLDGVPRRSLVLRSPSTLRCMTRVEPGMKFRANVGYWGNGSGVAVARIVEDGEAPKTVAEKKVTGGTGAVWSPVTIDLSPFVGRIVGIELGASDATGGGRVAFGEPSIRSERADPEAAAPEVPRTSVVVVIVAAGLDRRLVPPWGPIGGFSALGRLVRDGAAFDRFRAPTTVVGPVLASLLTGLSPRAHGLEDTTSRLSEDVRLVSERVKEESTRTAFFTGVPMSFGAFGFDRGWDRFESFSPVKDVPGAEASSRGAAWIKEQVTADRDGKLLLVVHSRGGHPPWDVTKDEVSAMPPEEYSGPLEARAGALVLANLRLQKQRGPIDQRLSGDDWRRLRALEEGALRKEDAGVRRIIDVLERERLYDRALIVFMGDVAPGDPPGVPFSPVPPLREDVLLAPLLVKFPGGALAGTHVGTMVSTVDVTKTLLAALGVASDGVEGADLFRLAKGDMPLGGHPLVATLGSRYSTRWGPWLLSGDVGRRPTLCQIDVDPACATDVFAQNPLSADALWQRTFRAEVAARKERGRAEHGSSPASLDQDTQSAMKVFGY